MMDEAEEILDVRIPIPFSFSLLQVLCSQTLVRRLMLLENVSILQPRDVTLTFSVFFPKGS